MALALHTQPMSVRPVRSSRPAAAVYRRRRFAVGVVLASLAFGGLLATGATAGQSDNAPGIEMPRTITAQRGDTLWAIAHRLAPEGNVVALVDALVRLNGDQIVAGQQIRLP